MMLVDAYDCLGVNYNICGVNVLCVLLGGQILHGFVDVMANFSKFLSDNVMTIEQTLAMCVRALASFV
jgi:hypothetical protein